MIQETTYLNEVKFRNQLRRDVSAHKVGASVANKSDRYSGGYIHVESHWKEQGWFKVAYSARHWDNANTAYRNGQIQLALSQMLHLLGYEVKIVEERSWIGDRVEKVALYRKAE